MFRGPLSTEIKQNIHSVCLYRKEENKMNAVHLRTGMKIEREQNVQCIDSN